jgi:hypothetical protein
MSDDPPRPDQLPGPIQHKEPTGKPEDRPLYRIRQEYKNHHRAQSGEGAANDLEGDGNDVLNERSAGNPELPATPAKIHER